MASPNVNLVKYLAFCVSLQWLLVKKLKKKWPKNAKKLPKFGHFFAIFQFFSKNTCAIVTKTPMQLFALPANIFSRQWSSRHKISGPIFFLFFFPFF